MQALLRKNSLNCKGRLLLLDTPKVMGILNLTPDSYFENSRIKPGADLIDRAGQMMEVGASIIDLGGQSTRPGATLISEDEEAERVIPAVESLHKAFPECILSIDTFYASVAQMAVRAGASIVNDVSGGEDPLMFPTVAKLAVPYVLMHRPGNAQEMQGKAVYENVALEVASYFSAKLEKLRALQIADIILDPGFGFGKLLKHNYDLVRDFDAFKIFELPLMVGVSRKKMVQQIIQKGPEEALNATTALHMALLAGGASILRVHDVREAKECIDIFMAIQA